MAVLIALATPTAVQAQDDATRAALPPGDPAAPAGDPADESGPPAPDAATAADAVDESLPPDLRAREGLRVMRLTLTEALTMALERNLDLKAAAYGPSLADASLAEAESIYDHLFTARVAGGETKIPVGSAAVGSVTKFSEDNLGGAVGLRRLLSTGGTVSLEATADRTLSNSAFNLFNPFWETSAAITLRQPLLRSAGREVTESGIGIARSTADLADLDLRNRAEILVRNTETTYWSLVNARGQVEVQGKSLEVARDLARITEARLAAGAGTRVDVSQAGAGVAAREVDLLRAENNMRALEETLLGFILPNLPEITGPDTLRILPADSPSAALPPLPQDDLAAVVEHAYVHRTDLMGQRAQVERAEYALVRAESDVLVRLDLESTVRYAGLDSTMGRSFSDSAASRDFGSWSVGLFLEVPIGNRAARARLARFRLQRDQAEARVRALLSNVHVRVRNARRELESNREQITAARRSVELAEEQLDAERQRLRNDKSTTFEVLRLEEDLTRARIDELRALVGYRNAIASYDFERGDILQRRGLAVPDPEGANLLD